MPMTVWTVVLPALGLLDALVFAVLAFISASGLIHSVGDGPYDINQ